MKRKYNILSCQPAACIFQLLLLRVGIASFSTAYLLDMWSFAGG